MRQILTIILFLSGRICLANMASPVLEGTRTGSAFSSHDIDILKEKIYLKIDKDFKTAFYRIEYLIRTDTAGQQIPMLFIAKDYKGNFSVWVDNREIKVLDVPYEYKTIRHTPFEKFSNSFNRSSRDEEGETVEIFWQENSGTIYYLNDLKYFEIDLTKGEHQIRVEYMANVWTDRSDWVKEYSFRYSLSPAKYWKSFDNLEITLDASNFTYPLTTNLGKPNKGQNDGISVWNFSELPADFFEVIYKPGINGFAKAMIAVRPIGMALIFFVLTAFLHLIGIKKYRRKEPAKKHSRVVIAGSIILPFIVLLIYMFSFNIIDLIIGDAASNYHGYYFLAIILYPFLMPVYWIIMWLADKRIKGRIINNS